MWENFDLHDRYMKYFVAHRNAIIPKIKERIKNNEASEDEKRILYGFLLDKEEVMKT